MTTAQRAGDRTGKEMRSSEEEERKNRFPGAKNK